MAALRHFVTDVRSLHPRLEIDVAAAGWPAEVPRGLELAFFRVAQEALQNVVEHSGARTAGITLRGTARDLTLSVTDSGAGFDTGSQRSGRLGLVGMEDRLRLVGGRLTVESPPDGGTVVVAAVLRDAVDLIRLEERLARSRSAEAKREDGGAL